MTFDDRRLVVDGPKSSSAVISTISAAAPSHSRNQDCCWCVWGEPLGCGPREVEVVRGGYALFGGRWGDGDTQVTPLRLEDMVLAEQQLEPEQDTPPSVSSKFETDKENEWEKAGSIAGEKFGGPHEGGFTVSDVSLSASGNVLSAAPSTGTWAERVGGEEREKGRETDIQPETELAERRSRASGQQGDGGGRESLREISEAAGGRVGVVTASETAHILMASADSAESDGGSVPWGHYETFASVHLQRRGSDVMGGERVHDISDQTIRFAPAALKRREGMRGEGVGVLRGKSAESVKGLTGRRGPCLIVGENRSSCEMQTQGAFLSPSTVCEGPKRRRLSSLSVAVSKSQSDRRGGEEAVVTGRVDAVFCLSSVPQHDSSLQRLSFDRVKIQNHEVVCHREAAVCGSFREEGGMEREPFEGEGSLGELREPAGPAEGPECPHTHRHTDNRDDVTVTSRRDVQQQPARRVNSTGGIGVGRVGKKRAHTGEVKRDRHGNILCPHEKVRSTCKECGGKGICEHGRQRHRCKDCGGKSICEHGRERCQCKECGGKSICEHGRIRSQCKECGGKDICQHGRRRSTCKECGGKSICEHGRRRSQCKECGGKGICLHGRERHRCKECGGKGICEHGRRRTQCKDCGGGSIFEHSRIRSKCKECGGKGICEHGRKRSRCKECGGQGICEHGRQRYFCKECGGGAFCVHRRERRYCHECKQVSSLPP
eukprot:Cvel_11029.t1-p1 / transcript=Cvel_11029.t1 / gene=Cvel_11029 / organism=Chromera_velia_CCMP2878 / gene_product=Zinc finger protein 283, putative / transcript_product=Zinc finger protein 283, putative / location=Cvel_scaffold680:33973-36123(-) / protein_length=717 / sequence_SO=supercontig / SO=protein_coding / is_pseudo=false